MNRKEAFRIASACVSIHGRGYSWTITGPYRVDRPRGACTTANASSYRRAQLKAAAWKAEVVCALLGGPVDACERIDYACAMGYGVTDTRGLVRAGMGGPL